jgi:hypothetical protein
MGTGTRLPAVSQVWKKLDLTQEEEEDGEEKK